MKKNWIVFLLVMLTACNPPSSAPTLRVLVPTGAPTIAFVPMILEELHTVVTVSGTDLLLAGFVNPNPEYDIIIAPINVGAKLIENNSTTYRLWGVLTWGNLYIVAQDETTLTQAGTLALFGENAIPQKIFDALDISSKVALSTMYYPSVADASMQLLTQRSQAAMLAQPLVSAVIANASKNNQSLQVVLDLQQLWKEKTGFDNYPQAAIFVEAKAYENKSAIINQQLLSIQQYLIDISFDKEKLMSDLSKIVSENLGLPATNILVDAFDQMNIRLEKAEDVIDEIQYFLEFLEIFLIREHFLK